MCYYVYKDSSREIDMSTLKSQNFSDFLERPMMHAIVAVLLQSFFQIILTFVLISMVVFTLVIGTGPTLVTNAIIDSEETHRCYQQPFECSKRGREIMRKQLAGYPGEGI